MQARNADRGTILLVEDEAILRMVMTEQLTDLGFVSIETADARAALAILGGDEPVRLVITDVALPGMDGCSLAAEAQRLRPGLPILFSTGDATTVRAWRGYDEASMAVLAKPFPLEGLGGIIDGLIGEVPAAQSDFGGSAAVEGSTSGPKSIRSTT